MNYNRSNELIAEYKSVEDKSNSEEDAVFHSCVILNVHLIFIFQTLQSNLTT